MIIKHNNLKQRYDIVIIGGGIAGLALSRFLNLENRKILIVEAGNFKFDREINNKSFAPSKELGNWPSKNYSSFYSRVRMFGGNANVWGGWCMELDGYDFKNNEIYDQRIHVEVLDFLRDEKKFNSFEELKDQILKDVKKAKLFHENK